MQSPSGFHLQINAISRLYERISNHIGTTGELILYADHCTYLLPTCDSESAVDIVNEDLPKLADCMV